MMFNNDMQKLIQEARDIIASLPKDRIENFKEAYIELVFSFMDIVIDYNLTQDEMFKIVEVLNVNTSALKTGLKNDSLN